MLKWEKRTARWEGNGEKRFGVERTFNGKMGTSASERERRAANEEQRTSANVDVKGENPLGASLRERVKRVFRLALN